MDVSSTTNTFLTFFLYSRLARINETDHRKHIVETLTDWWLRNRDSLGAPDGILTDGEDFSISFIADTPSVHVRLLCSCGVKIQLVRYGEHFTLTNYYKHLRKTKCSVVKKKKKNVPDGDTFDSNDNEETSTSMKDQDSSNGANDQDSSNNPSTSTSFALYSVASSASANSIDRMIISRSRSKRSSYSQEQSSLTRTRHGR